jgi:hypothetical protein
MQTTQSARYRSAGQRWRLAALCPRCLPAALYQRCLLAALLIVANVLVAGLHGCSCRDEAELAQTEKEKHEKDKDKEKLKKEKKEKPKPDFEPFHLTVEPADPQALVRVQAVKPGHWSTALVDGQPNNFDFPGELRTEVVDRLLTPVGIERTTFHLVTSRPAILAKGQKKQLEFNFMPPQGETKTWLHLGLLDRRGGEVKTVPEMLAHMPSFEYFLFVLSSQVERYKFLKLLDSVRPPSADLQSGSPDLFYRVVLPKLSGKTPLPAQSLCWTSLAYLIWDDAEPTLLQPDQQQALIDWLHWGGQLVISGPQTLDVLERSFLAPYLPAKARTGIRQLDAAALGPLDEQWTIAGFKSKRLNVDKPWIGIGLEKHPQASFVPGTGELLAERRVGRGRIVVSAFRLSQPQLLAWPSFDSFFNACVLRRPPRDFEAPNGLLEFNWADDEADRWNSRLVTSLRYFSRDERGKKTEKQAQADWDARAAEDLARKTMPQQQQSLALPPGFQSADADESMRRTQCMKQSGVAGWNDFSEVSNAARRSLREAAGIVIPTRDFVLKILSVYLLILVPVNWMLFRLVGRIEFAWIAAPLIAVVGAAAVIRLAQLDIGFARSQTEIATLELHAGYPRAHLTRYTALYTSLSSSYDVKFDDPSAVALPLSNDFALISGQRLSNVNYRRDTDVRLTDIEIRSNSTAMLHSEQMYDLGGTLDAVQDAAGEWTVQNGTKLTLAGAGVVRKSLAGEQRVAWVGALAPGQHARLVFDSATSDNWDEKRRELRRAEPHHGALIDIDHLLKLAQESRDMSPEEMRLVAWMEGGLQGLQVEPVAAQTRQATLVVANLQFGIPAPPKPDKRLRIDVAANRLDDARDTEDDPQTDDPQTREPASSLPIDRGRSP